MPAPQVVSVSSAHEETDVVLGTQVVVTFDQEIDPASITDSTFLLSGPGDTQVITADQMNSIVPTPFSGDAVIPGTFDFAIDEQGRSIVKFDPKHALDPDKTWSLRPAATKHASRAGAKSRSACVSVSAARVES